MNDALLLASFADGQLRRAFGTLGLLDDLLSQLAIAELTAASAERLSNVAGLYLVAECWGDRHRAVAGKPETLRIKFQQSWWLGRTVAKLKAQLEGGQLG